MEVPTNPTRQNAFVWICGSFFISAHEILVLGRAFFARRDARVGAIKLCHRPLEPALMVDWSRTPLLRHLSYAHTTRDFEARGLDGARHDLDDITESGVHANCGH
jgi:hypothetical protein